MGNVQESTEITQNQVWNPNDTPAPTIEQTENTPHIMMGGSDRADGYR